MKPKRKFLLLGIALGSLAAFPLGINFGRNAPLLSNPFSRLDLTDQVVERVKSGTSMALKEARETIHDATKPLSYTK